MICRRLCRHGRHEVESCQIDSLGYGPGEWTSREMRRRRIWFNNLIIYLILNSRVRVRTLKWRKKKACPARVAEAGQENIETVHEPKPIQAADTL